MVGDTHHLFYIVYCELGLNALQLVGEAFD